ncbi:MAG: hypothetical protein RL235_962 [Chlamydiota bacterium]|jgi:peptidyl-dipeptidase A
MPHAFERFLEEFVPVLEKKTTQLNRISWVLETTGHPDVALLKAELDAEARLLFNDSKVYAELVAWDKDPYLKDPLLKRQLNVLLRAFRQNQIPKQLVEEIAHKEALLSQTYAMFRANVDGVALSENEIREAMKEEISVAKRKQMWEASKQIGAVLAPQILALVRLRNQAASELGFSDYFQMQLALQEVDDAWLSCLLKDVGERSSSAYEACLAQIRSTQASRYQTAEKELGPWAWSDPFCQEDPLDASELDQLVQGVDLVQLGRAFYDKMGIDVGGVLAKSDMFERPGKCQHAFCTHIDRRGDVRTLNNVNASIKWLETVLHELGHAIYDLGIDQTLPWLLREPPHMIPTEAMALIAGRQAYRYEALQEMIEHKPEALMRKADASLQRRQLIFSRWVLVMTDFERQLYRNPDQDLNHLWWSLVERHQQIVPPPGREGQFDWATKYHIGLAPVYYFSYLLGELFASAIQEKIESISQSASLSTKQAGAFLNRSLFAVGNRMRWDQLVEHVVGKSLTADAWLSQFC